MSTQITVRIPDDLARFIDEQVAAGTVESRAQAVSRALALHQQRLRAEQELDLITRHGGQPYDDLDDVADRAPAADADLD